MSLQTNLTLQGSFNFQSSSGGQTGQFRPQLSRVANRLTGTGLNQADLAWWDFGRTIPAASADDIDLAGGPSTAYGATLSFTKVKGIWIENLNTDAADTLEIGGAANPFLLFKDGSDIYELGPGGLFFIEEPSLAALPVTAGTGDILRLNNPGANNIDVDILIWGVD